MAPTLPSVLCHQLVDATDSVRHVIAKRAITLLPVMNNTYKFQPYTGTAGYVVAGGVDSPRCLRIFAEDIYIHVGSSFEFPGKHVSISAHRIIAVRLGNVKAEDDKILFDCSGPIPPLANPKAASGGPGTKGEMSKSPSGGGSGTNGQAGVEGKHGGSFCLAARLYSLSDKPVSLVVNCGGGKGGPGQAGGDGGTGGRWVG
jgi:hypothetical protein